MKTKSEGTYKTKKKAMERKAAMERLGFTHVTIRHVTYGWHVRYGKKE